MKVTLEIILLTWFIFWLFSLTDTSAKVKNVVYWVTIILAVLVFIGSIVIRT